MVTTSIKVSKFTVKRTYEFKSVVNDKSVTWSEVVPYTLYYLYKMD